MLVEINERQMIKCPIGTTFEFGKNKNKKALKTRDHLVLNAFFLGKKGYYFFKSTSSVTPSFVIFASVSQLPSP